VLLDCIARVSALEEDSFLVAGICPAATPPTGRRTKPASRRVIRQGETPARLASGQAPSKRRHRPGVNRSRPADPRRERNASPLPGSARQPVAWAAPPPVGPGALGRPEACEQGVVVVRQQ
jgi:hypothetical protein